MGKRFRGLTKIGNISQYGESGEVIVETENIKVTPTKEEQIINRSDGKYIETVYVDPIPDEYIVPEGTLNIGENGTYDVKDKESVKVEVLVEEPTIIAKNVIDNGIYNASDDNADGFSTVNVIVLSTAASPLTIDMPANFNSVSTIYYFQINNDRILMSGSATDIGLWSYRVSTKTWKQVYAQGKNYSVFKMAGDRCFVGQSQSDNVSMLVYSYTDDEVICVSEPCDGGRYTFKQVGDYWFCYAASWGGGLDVYDPTNNTLTRIIQNGYKWQYIYQFDDNYLLGSESSYGFYLFEPKTNTCTQLLTGGSKLNRMVLLNESIAILSCSSSYGTKGAYSYNNTTKTAKQLISKLYDFSKFFQVSDTRWVCSNSGIWLYDSEIDTMTQLYTVSGSWSNVQRQGDVTFISSTSSSYKGVLLYDDSTQTVTQIYAAGYNWKDVYKLGNKYLVTAGLDQGVLLYDNETKECTQIWGSGAYCLGKVIGDVCLLGGLLSASTGILMYDSTTNEITQIYETGYYYNLFVMSGNDCLISSDTQNVSILLFDGATKIITALTDLTRIKTFVDVEGGNYLCSPVYGYGFNMLLYDSSTKTVSEVYFNNAGHDVAYSHKVERGFLITSGKHPNLLFYNTSDKTLTNLGALRTYHMFVTFDDGNDCIFTPLSGNYGLDLYNIATKTITQSIWSTGSKFDIVEENELGALLSSSNSPSSTRAVVQYNKNDKTCALVGYYIS